jgi:deoxyribodipyrimidine photo-lyase
MDDKINIFWFRRDLRTEDNHGLHRALNDDLPVLPVFIFDTEILNDIENKNDRRITFIHEQVSLLKETFQHKGSDVKVYFGKPEEVFHNLLQKHSVHSIFCNHDYEPYAQNRDKTIENLATKHTIPFISFKDQVITEKNEVLKKDGTPYTVFTPYMRQWKKNVQLKEIPYFESKELLSNTYQCNAEPMIPLAKLGFKWIDHKVGKALINDNLIKNYHQTRDFLAKEGTSRLSVHLRFGTISIRQLVKKAFEWNETYLNELIWREFYMMILWHYPYVVTQSFKPAYDKIEWNSSEEEFERWCQGKTGYPIVDAAMHQLLSTGYMHNRARMIVSSFLTKHLLIDWRKGEAFFAKHLTDYELSSNNGGWQWASGTGCDAAPYFRIFNPYTQAKKFDPEGKYIQQWLPNEIIPPIIEHPVARERCLRIYKKALNP